MADLCLIKWPKVVQYPQSFSRVGSSGSENFPTCRLGETIKTEGRQRWRAGRAGNKFKVV